MCGVAPLLLGHFCGEVSWGKKKMADPMSSVEARTGEGVLKKPLMKNMGNSGLNP